MLKIQFFVNYFIKNIQILKILTNFYVNLTAIITENDTNHCVTVY